MDEWNVRYFRGRLSSGVLAALAPLEVAEPDAQALAERALRLMCTAGIEAEDVAVFTAWLLGFSAPRTVHSHWGKREGMVGPGVYMRGTPVISWSWNLAGEPVGDSSYEPRRTVHEVGR